MSQIKYVNLSDLSFPEFQAHQNISPDNLKEITESIKSIGIIEPLIVRQTNTGLEIVAGCVRFQAAKLAGLKAVPCINMSLDPKAAEIIKLHENIKRIPLNHVDQGETFIMMMEKFKMTELQISESVGKSTGYISQHISLVHIYKDLSDAVKNDLISFSQARELMRLDDESERRRLISHCQNNGATVRVLHSWVDDYLRDSTPSPPVVSDTPEEHYDYNNPYISRQCEACLKSVDLNIIRQVFYCPECHRAIKTAISEENDRKVSKNTQ